MMQNPHELYLDFRCEMCTKKLTKDELVEALKQVRKKEVTYKLCDACFLVWKLGVLPAKSHAGKQENTVARIDYLVG